MDNMLVERNNFIKICEEINNNDTIVINMHKKLFNSKVEKILRETNLKYSRYEFDIDDEKINLNIWLKERTQSLNEIVELQQEIKAYIKIQLNINVDFVNIFFGICA